ncbi:trypsin-like serine peptidase [Rhizobium leguminosarum]|uniref:trypsin-like serine peptidase n=1 Tax=Rhizobium leguminosarum TaxID=384 RepID=UPI001F265B9B|nr:serine protease [Rhizobium leguminosarum]UIK19519.1 serine protease [Rhizobium leguminosarum]
MALQPRETGTLVDLLAGALSEYDLQTIVAESTGDDLYVEWVGSGNPLKQTIRELIEAMEKVGVTPQFLAEVYRKRPRRNDVRQGIALLYPEIIGLAAQAPADFDLQTQGITQEKTQGTFAPGLQRNIKNHLNMLSIGQWAQRLSEIQRQVCLVEISGRSAGTGFLVGPNAVLTNWHVVEGAQANIVCRFDYAEHPVGGRETGTRVAGQVVWHRPYAQAELTSTPDNPPPLSTELDFALIELASVVGTEGIVGMERGFIELPSSSAPIAVGTGVIIVQHPDGAPMKLVIDSDAVQELPPPGNWPRIRYSTNTAPGSSGSPCFTMEWELIAIHHFGDPAWKAVFNQGVPAYLVREDIVAAGHGPLLR